MFIIKGSQIQSLHNHLDRLHVLVQREVGFLSEAHLLARPLTSDGGEVLARASMEAWHIYFAEKSAENAYNFVDFVMSKIGPSGPLKELLHQVRVDMMLFAAQWVIFESGRVFS